MSSEFKWVMWVPPKANVETVNTPGVSFLGATRSIACSEILLTHAWSMTFRYLIVGIRYFSAFQLPVSVSVKWDIGSVFSVQ